MSVKNILNLIETRGIHGESWILLLHVGEASNHFGSKGSCVFPGIWGRAKPKNGGCQTEFPKAKKMYILGKPMNLKTSGEMGLV